MSAKTDREVLFRQIAEALDIPDSHILEHGFALVSYIGPDGDPLYAHLCFGNPQISQTMGLMELVKFTMLRTLEDDGELHKEEEL